jgi:alpha-L-fucosidase
MLKKICSSNILLILIICLPAAFNAQTTGDGDAWEALRNRPYPQWFTDAKLGIFIHWGVYSVPAYSGKESYGEWFLRGLQSGDSLRINFMREQYGEDFTYYDFAPLFKAGLFNPNEWADLFRQAGARYVVLVSKHHDGYCLWPSRYARGWHSMALGPKRDLVGELTEAVRHSGLKMGLYYSLAEWNHPLHRWYADPPDEIGPYVEHYMIPQFKELVSTYRPSLIFADGEWFNSAEQWRARELISWYYDLVGPEAIVNNRWGAGSDIGFLTPEYSAGLVASERPWAEVRGLGRSFALNRNESLDAYMSPEELIHFFVQAVANGGGMILNVGPGADGQIPLLQQERLLQLGKWLSMNGEAIYGSRSWIRTMEEKPVGLERIDPNIDFDWVRNSPGDLIKEDAFTAVWTGFLQPDRSGDYLFELAADDEARLWLDGQEMADKEAVKTLKSGKRYPIRIEYEEKDLNASIRLSWMRPDGVREIVPARYFFTTDGAGAKNGLQARYESTQPYRAFTQTDEALYLISFEWPDEELHIEMERPDKSMQVNLLGRTGELPWTYRKGVLTVDLSGIPFSEIPGKYAWVFRFR